jgi:hypothetical protein
MSIEDRNDNKGLALAASGTGLPMLRTEPVCAVSAVPVGIPSAAGVS